MSPFIKESSKELEIVADCDVLIAGGGIAGVSAAIAAARNGSRTILIEREYGLGGLATLGLITIYLPMDDGEGHNMVHGIGEELLKLSIKYGAEKNYPTAWLENGTKEERINKRYTTQYNPHLFSLSMEKLLIDLGVQIIYGTLAVSVSMNDANDKIKAVILENKSGRSAITVKSVVDATGDADICKFAGENTVLYSQGNSLASWYYYFKKDEIMLRMFGLVDVPDDEKDEGTIANEASDIIHEDRYSGVDGIPLSKMVIDAHEKMMDDILAHKAEDDSFVPVTISSIPLVRTTRKIEGQYTMNDDETDKYMADSIGTAGDWRKRGPRYELPFKLLYGNKVKNLLTAGRNISVTEEMWEITRVIPVCAVTGEAAGTAASFCDDFGNIDIGLLQQKLKNQGVVLHIDDMDLD